MNRARRASFTLIEVLVALSVFSIGSIAIAYSLSVSLRARTHVEKETTALFLLDRKASELFSAPQRKTGTFEGGFGDNYATYKWKATLVPLVRDLVRADVQVIWLDRGREHEASVATIVKGGFER